MSLLNPMDDDQLDAIIQGLERIKALEAEIARLRITDKEREALERICEATDDIIDEDKRANGVHWQEDAAAVAVVRGLLHRMGGGE